MTDTTGLDPRAAAEAEAAADAEADAHVATDDDEGPSVADYSVAFSPRQVAVGLAIVAGLIGYLVARRRHGSRGDEG